MLKDGLELDLYKGDCLLIMDKLIARGVKIKGAVIVDLPYGTTKCSWDVLIPFDKIWERLDKLTYPNTPILLTAVQPFTSLAVMSNLKDFRYSLVYEKTTSTGHLNAKKMPMRSHEDILVFYKKLPTYNPIKTTGHLRKVSSASSRAKSITRNNEKDKVYNNEIEDKVTNYASTERYPRSVIKFSTDKQKSTLHPTQKPVALMEWLVQTYTNEGDTILDFTMGSGTTGRAALNLRRGFVGIEQDKKHFKTCKDRLRYDIIKN